ncbi:UCH37_bd domain-containing protein [Cephalotus follicularis]|uniref:Protein TIC 40, chloroplastic n=1 Tax=Cephalotus follicularis TaxID=3775 RepID=A0A1Q3C998_CEPFO|nr:UCH37_bd domain-containing protein [Cephalotus follicularis]
MAFVSSSSSPKLVLSCPSPKNPTRREISTTKTTSFSLPFTLLNSMFTPRGSRISASAFPDSSPISRNVVIRMPGGDRFANISSSTNQQNSSVGATPNLVPPPPSSSSQIGSPLFWIGVGVGFSALYTWVKRLAFSRFQVSVFSPKNTNQYVMQQTMKTLMNQTSTQNNPFGDATFSPPFPYSTPISSSPAPAPSSPAVSKPAVTVNIPATEVAAVSASEVKDEEEAKNEKNKHAFVDVSPEETILKSPFESFEDVAEASSSKDVQFPQEVSQNGAASKHGFGASEGFRSPREAGSGLSVEALERMMEDPMVQKMVYPYLPEEMRNPQTFKWMMQNPQYRQQLEDMLKNMSGNNDWNDQMIESWKNFDVNNPEIKQQFDQIGLTPEEVIGKIMANPEVAQAFQSPKVQAAIMDCSTNPQNISKYQNDQEVMDVFNKISELFPGVSGTI